MEKVLNRKFTLIKYNDGTEDVVNFKHDDDVEGYSLINKESGVVELYHNEKLEGIFYGVKSAQILERTLLQNAHETLLYCAMELMKAGSLKYKLERDYSNSLKYKLEKDYPNEGQSEHEDNS